MIDVGQLSSRRALVQNTSGITRIDAARPAPPGMCDLLRDASLLVAMQTAGGKVEIYEPFRKHCTLLIEQFAAALNQRGYAKEVCREAVDALCALLDEVAVRSLRDADKNTWLGEPLQVALFQKHNAGEFVFDRLEAHMREASPHVDLLECYAAVLGLGFTGRYALEGEAKRQGLMRTLSTLLARLRPADGQSFYVEPGGQRLRSWFYRFFHGLSPWGLAGLALVCAVSMWLTWHVALDARSAAVLSKAESSVTAP